MIFFYMSQIQVLGFVSWKGRDCSLESGVRFPFPTATPPPVLFPGQYETKL